MAGLRDSHRRIKSYITNIKNAFTLAAALPRFFREQITFPRAQDDIRRILERRGENFCELVRTQVFDAADTPYRKLFKYAGCELSDLRGHVQRHGVEETLVKLAEEGVYFTSDEFKGKTGVVRGTSWFRVSPFDFERSGSLPGFGMQSSGTRNAPVKTFSPLDWRALQSLGEAVFYEAHNLFSRVHAIYEPVIAGRMHFILVNAKVGVPMDRWFAINVGVHSTAEDSYHYLNARLVALMGRVFGPGIADPEYLDGTEVRPILDWILEKKREARNCCIRTVASNAARISQAALNMGISLEGVTFHASGEPLTRSKKELIEKAGAYPILHYGPGGGNGCAYGCANPSFIDEVHVPKTLFTLVEYPRPLQAGGVPIYPLMLTTLHHSAPRFLLNVQNGDYATAIARDCGCPLQKVGFTQHLHTIRSFEKFTSEGVNYFTTDLFELLENTLPSEFGGGPGDYQLIEEEDHEGRTRLSLLVHPNVGEIDEEKLIDRLYRSLSAGSRNNRFMSKIWLNAATFRLRREAPRASARGKILPLHIAR